MVIKKDVARWFVMFLIGVFTALIACFIDIVIDQLATLKFNLIKRCILLPLDKFTGSAP
jgi:chloride channel 7